MKLRFDFLIRIGVLISATKTLFISAHEKCGEHFVLEAMKGAHHHDHERRRLNAVSSNFNTRERTSTAFATPSCMTQGAWGRTNECFNAEVATAYSDAHDRLSPVTVKVENCVIANSTGQRTISQADLDRQIAVANRVFNQANVTIEFNTRLVTNDTLYGRYFNGFQTGRSTGGDACENIDLSCINSCTTGMPTSGWDVPDDLCTVIDAFWPSHDNRNTCLNSCSQIQLDCIEMYLIQVGGCTRSRYDVGYYADTSQMFRELCQLESGDRVSVLWAPMANGACAMGLNRDTGDGFRTFFPRVTNVNNLNAIVVQDTEYLPLSGCGGYDGNTLGHEIGHALSLYHTFEGADFATLSSDNSQCDAPTCASKNNDWNTGDFIRGTGVWGTLPSDSSLSDSHLFDSSTHSHSPSLRYQVQTAASQFA